MDLRIVATVVVLGVSLLVAISLARVAGESDERADETFERMMGDGRRNEN